MSVFAAVVYLILQYVAGVILYLPYEGVAFWAAIAQLLPLYVYRCASSRSETKSTGTCRFIVYPLMKRITYWPQAWLGIAMNFGVVVSWVAVTNKVDLQLLTLLMVGSWGWTMHYGSLSSSPSTG